MPRKTQLFMKLCVTAAFLINPSMLTADEKTVDKTRPADVAEASLPPATGEWKQWRGPDRANKSPETNLLTEWPEEGPPLAWRAEGLGEGIASISIADGHIFTMTYANDLEFLVALDQATGSLRWAAPVGPAVQEMRLMRWLSQRSPTLDGDRLYALTGHGVLVCLSTKNGQEHWRKSYMDEVGGQKPWWGFCDYPLVDGDRLICVPGRSEASMVALNKHTGDVLWKSIVPSDAKPHSHISYAATSVIEIGGIRQYVNFLQGALVGIAADDGRLLWRYDKLNVRRGSDPQSSSFTPLVRDDLLFCVGGRGAAFAMLKLTAREGQMSVHEEYQRKFYFNHFQDHIIWVGDRVFASDSRGSKLFCLDVNSGETLWEYQEPRTIRQSRFIATTYAGGHLFVRSATGTVRLIEDSDQHYIEKGRFEIPDHQPAIGATTPVVAGGHLYLRDGDRLFAYDIRRDALATNRPEPNTVMLHLPEDPLPVTEFDGHRAGILGSVFVPTPQDVVEKMLELAAVKPSDRVYDLGSGDGRIVVTAAQKYGSHAVGYEHNEGLVAVSRAAVSKEGLEELVSIEQEDIYNVDLNEADVVAVYLLPKQLEKLIPQFEKLPSGARIVSHYFKIPGIEPDQSEIVRSKADGALHHIYLYQAPLAK